MPAMVRDGEPYDPDDVKVPQGPEHERIVAMLRVATAHLLEPSLDLFVDMNWYPPDGGHAVAPDLMLVPAGAVVAAPSSRDPNGRPKSYRQDELDGPAPLVVVEVASATDTVASMFQKLVRYQKLGPVAYLIRTIGRNPGVYRFGPRDRAPVDWSGRPMPELGGFRVGITDRRIEVTIADGVQGDSAEALIEALVATGKQRAEAQRQQAETERQQAEAERQQAEDRAEALARQLEALGITPEA